MGQKPVIAKVDAKQPAQMGEEHGDEQNEAPRDQHGDRRPAQQVCHLLVAGAQAALGVGPVQGLGEVGLVQRKRKLAHRLGVAGFERGVAAGPRAALRARGSWTSPTPSAS